MSDIEVVNVCKECGAQSPVKDPDQYWLCLCGRLVIQDDQALPWEPVCAV